MVPAVAFYMYKIHTYTYTYTHTHTHTHTLTHTSTLGGVANTSFTSVSAELSRSDSLSTDESGLWSNVQLITGGQSPNASRMLGR